MAIYSLSKKRKENILQNQPKYHLKCKKTLSHFLFPIWTELYLRAKLILCNVLTQRDIQTKEWKDNEDPSSSQFLTTRE